MNQIVMPMRKLSSLRFAPFCAVALAVASAVASCSPRQSSTAANAQPPLSEGQLYGSTIGGAFELTGTDGETVRWTDFDGKWRMVYFGYAYCPDVCPPDMTRMIKGYNAFAAENPGLAGDVVPIFISIDPERDTPEVVGQFANAFSDKLVGLTGTQEQVDKAADAFVVYRKKGAVNEEGGYLMGHSNLAYLMGRDGEPVALLSVDKSGEAVAQELATWVR